MSRRGVVAALLAAGLAACAGDDEPRLDARDAKSFVLQPADLPRVFVRFDEGRERASERGRDPGSRSRGVDARPEIGWHARYRRPGSAATSGPLVVESRADVFADAELAGEGLDSYRRDFGGADAGRSGPTLGDEAFTAGLPAGTTGGGATFYAVGWRYRNVAAFVTVSGVRSVTVDDALELARKQQARLEEAG